MANKRRTTPVRKGRPTSKSSKHLYFFGNGRAEGNRTMRDLLGGKGAGLAEMTNAKLPVPPGFTIATTVCTLYYEHKGKLPPAIEQEMRVHLKKLEAATRATFGSATNPLLVSVRSGAKFSMACHAAVKANDALTREKMQYLLDELRRTSHSSVCPHGRPVVLRLTRREIERNFERV